jgi:hypothetical protein
MYIVSYISKSQKGMSALLDQAAKEAKEGNLDLKRQVRHIGNYFVNSVETSAQEADIFSNSEVFLSKNVLLSGGEVLIQTTCLVAFVKGICKVK